MKLIFIKDLDAEKKTYIAVDINNILYIKLQAEETYVFYNNGDVIPKKIRTARPKFLNLEVLGKSFLMIGKGMLINVKIIQEITFLNSILKFKSGQTLTIKSPWKDILLKYLNEYHLFLDEYKPELRSYQKDIINIDKGKLDNNNILLPRFKTVNAPKYF